MAGDLIEQLDLGNTQFVRQLKKLDPPVFAMVYERMALLMKPPPYPSVPPGASAHGPHGALGA